MTELEKQALDMLKDISDIECPICSEWDGHAPACELDELLRKLREAAK